MSSYKIISDSSCDLPDEVISKLDITLVPFYVSLDGTSYKKENVELHVKDFYKALRETKAFPKSSLPTITDYTDTFTPILSAGQDILCITLTNKFSGSYQSAVNAANILRESFPGRRIIILDSANATLGQGAIVLAAAGLRNQGFGIDEIVQKLKGALNSFRIVFTVGSLEYLKRGGRIGKASALMGDLLNIKPILALHDGELYPVSKIRGRRKALAEIVRLAIEETHGKTQDYKFGILHADCIDDANFLAEILKTEHGIDVELPFSYVGVTIGAHTGPDTLGVIIAPRV